MKKFFLAIFIIAVAAFPAGAQTFNGGAVNLFGSSAAQTTSILPVADTIGVTLPASAATVEVVSSSASDAAAGTGIRTLKISGLDSAWAEATETITMDGTTAAVTVNSYIRINKIEGLTFGSTGAAVGTITLGVGGAIYAQISPGYSHSRSAIYSVPANRYAFIRQWKVSGLTNPVKAELRVREYGKAYVTVDQINVNGVAGEHQFENNLAINQKSDIVISAASTTSTAVVAASALITLE